MNAVRKYYWKICVAADQPHPVLEHLASRTFEMETLDPPPEDGQAFVLLLDDFGGRSSPSDRCVEVEVTRRRKMLEYRNGRPIDSAQWYVLLYARVVRRADLP
jgi:hypothetical protein